MQVFHEHTFPPNRVQSVLGPPVVAVQLLIPLISTEHVLLLQFDCSALAGDEIDATMSRAQHEAGKSRRFFIEFSSRKVGCAPLQGASQLPSPPPPLPLCDSSRRLRLYHSRRLKGDAHRSRIQPLDAVAIGHLDTSDLRYPRVA